MGYEEALLNAGYVPSGVKPKRIGANGEPTWQSQSSETLGILNQALGGFFQSMQAAQQRKQEKLKNQFEYYKALVDSGYDPIAAGRLSQKMIEKGEFPMEPPSGQSTKMQEQQLKLQKLQADTIRSQAQANNLTGGGAVPPQGFLKVGGKTVKDPNYVSSQAEMKKLDIKELSEMQKTLPKLDQAVNAVGQLKNLFYQGFKPDQNPAMARVSGVGDAAAANVGLNPKGNRYLANRKAFAGLISKGGFGETGVLTQQDIQRVTDILPNEYATKEEADIAWKEIESILGSARKRYDTKKSQVFGEGDNQGAMNQNSNKGFSVGQIIQANGKNYKIIGGDPNDPDIEEVA